MRQELFAPFMLSGERSSVIPWPLDVFFLAPRGKYRFICHVQAMPRHEMWRVGFNFAASTRVSLYAIEVIMSIPFEELADAKLASHRFDGERPLYWELLHGCEAIISDAGRYALSRKRYRRCVKIFSSRQRIFFDKQCMMISMKMLSNAIFWLEYGARCRRAYGKAILRRRP